MKQSEFIDIWKDYIISNYFDGENCSSRTSSVEKPFRIPKTARFAESPMRVPFSIHVGVDNKDEARLSTSWSTCDSWCQSCKGLGCRKAGEMLLNVQCGHMELLLLRKITCFFWSFIFIFCVGTWESQQNFWCEKFHEPQELRTGDVDGEVYRYKAFAFIWIMIICVLSKTQPTLNMLFLA